MRYLVPLLLLSLAGCQTWGPNGGYDPSLTVNQIKAAAADKSAGVTCSVVPTPWGIAKVVVVTIDQRVIDAGGIDVDIDCNIRITTTKLLPAPRPAP